MDVDFLGIARILVRRGNMGAAYRVLARVYTMAAPEQVERKVRRVTEWPACGADGVMHVVPIA